MEPIADAVSSSSITPVVWCTSAVRGHDVCLSVFLPVSDRTFLQCLSQHSSGADQNPTKAPTAGDRSSVRRGGDARHPKG